MQCFHADSTSGLAACGPTAYGKAAYFPNPFGV
jgi:hypothetical protein